MNDRQDRKAFYRELGRYSALGFEMALSVLIGLGIGYYLDKWLGTAPWLMILWLGFGFAAGVRSLLSRRQAIRERAGGAGEGRKGAGEPRWGLRSAPWSGGSCSPPRWSSRGSPSPPSRGGRVSGCSPAAACGAAIACGNFFLVRKILEKAFLREGEVNKRFVVQYVLKFLGLIGIVYLVVRSGWFDVLGFLLGLSSLFLGVLLEALWKSFQPAE